MMDRACVAAVEASIYAAGYPTDAAAVLLVELDGQADAVEAEAGDRAARSCASAARATVRSASTAGRSGAALAGAEEGVRRHGADRARPRGPGRRGPALAPCPTSWTGSPRSATATGSPSATSSTPATATCTRTSASTAATRTSTHRVHVACREIMAACVEAGGSITGEHGVGSDKLDYMPWIFDPETLGAMRAVRRVFDPAERANPGQGRSRARLPRVARRAGGPMSDVVYGRLRALLGTERRRARSGRPAARHPRHRRRALAGLPAGPRGGLEDPGRGSGHLAPADAPADLAVSTRALDQVVSVSPADLVATVQAGTPLEALRRRLADEGMWLALDPPGRPERSLGSVIATATAGPLRHGFGPVRDHVLGCTVATGDGRLVKAGGRVVKNVAGIRPHQAPGRRVRRVRHHRRGASPAPSAAPGGRHPASRAAPATRSPPPRATSWPRSWCRPRSSCSRPRSRPRRTGCLRRGSSAPTPPSRAMSRRLAPIAELAWQPLPTDRTAAFWGLVARGSQGGPITLRLGVLGDGVDDTIDLLAHDLDEGLLSAGAGLGHDPLDRRCAAGAASRGAPRRRGPRDPDDARAGPLGHAPALGHFGAYREGVGQLVGRLRDTFDPGQCLQVALEAAGE